VSSILLGRRARHREKQAAVLKIEGRYFDRGGGIFGW